MAALMFILALASSINVLHAERCPGVNECATLQKDSSTFVLLGDWGGREEPEYTSPQQLKVADRIAQIASEQEIDYIVTTGDNFYFDGVSSVDDLHFNLSYEQVYHHSSVKDIVWYLTGGNHDHILEGSVEAEIEYTQKSNRWCYPDRSYSVCYNTKPDTKPVKIEFLMIDTVDLCGTNYRPNMTGYDEEYGPWFPGAENFKNDSDQPIMPKNITRGLQTLEWILESIQESRADYLFLVGHFPLWSASKHGPTQCLVELLEDAMVQSRVTAFLGGHDHDLQYLRVPYRNADNSTTQTHHLLSGLGGKSRFIGTGSHAQLREGTMMFYYTSDGPLYDVDQGDGGFVLINANSERAECRYINGNGDELFKVDLQPRWKQDEAKLELEIKKNL